MRKIRLNGLGEEIRRDFARPYRLPRNLFLAALGTFGGIAIGILIHTFKRGLPYIAADVFIWTLATYNASQLGSDSLRVLAKARNTDRIKELFIVKNISLLMIAIPIDITLIIIACLILNDWSKLAESIILALSAVVICLGLGNLVSVLWVYSPIPFFRMLKDRVLILEYIIFISIAYLAASMAILLASIPGELILKYGNIHSFSGRLVGALIMLGWAFILWIIFLYWADSLSRKYRNLFVGRLSGERINIKNNKIKKILKVD